MTDQQTTTAIPKWIEAKLFEKVLKENVKGYANIKEFNVRPAMAAGENYATVMLKVAIEVELEDSSSKTITFMLKTNHDSELVNEMMKDFDIFDIEKGMYDDIVPEFEKLYADVGADVRFGAKSYELATDEKYILLEDLSLHGFKNANRLEGLDMEHAKCALKRLAQWHAASAARVAIKGPYDEKYCVSYFKEEGKEMMVNMMAGMMQIFLDCARKYSNYGEYGNDLDAIAKDLTNQLFKVSHPDPNEFNVLNHGDYWSNNVMFQYDDCGKVKETYMVDFQMPKYGTPAQDLFYFIMSSTKYEIKLKQFDYFIKFYHDHLVDNLQTLKYAQKIPTLRDLHQLMYRYGIWALSTCTGVMGAVLLDPTNSASIENFVSDSDAGTAFKILMFSNDRYRKHMEAILPWLKNRGVLSLY